MEMSKELKKKKLAKKLGLESYSIGEPESSEMKLAPVGFKPSQEEKKEGKITYRKSSTPSEPNIIDARGMTREEGKKAVELQRLLREKKLRKKLESLK